MMIKWLRLIVYEPPLYQGNIWNGLPHGQFAFLEVHDTGSAPNSGIHRVVDEPFSSGEFPDPGLRLSAIRPLLHHMGGELRLQSGAWCGTSVVILLPYAIEHGLERAV